MGEAVRFGGARVETLPDVTHERLGPDGEDVVRVTVEKAPSVEEKPEGIRKAQRRWAALPDPQEGTDEGILGYNEHGRFD